MKRDNKELGFQLYMNNWNQKRISKVLGVTEATVSKWAKSDNWKQEKAKESNRAKECMDGIWKLIDYQTRALRYWTEINEADSIENKTPLKPIGKGDLDGLQKLHSIIRSSEPDFISTIQTMTKFLEYISTKNWEDSVLMGEYSIGFLEQEQNNRSSLS